MSLKNVHNDRAWRNPPGKTPVCVKLSQQDSSLPYETDRASSFRQILNKNYASMLVRS